MDEIKYFEDAWLELENELSSYQSHQPSSYQGYQSTTNTNNDLGDFNQTHLDYKSYEQLLSPQQSHTDQEVHSLTKIEDRIQAVKEYYNQNPFAVYAKLHKVANSLYKKGKVKQGNILLERGYAKVASILENALQKNVTYFKQIGDETRTLIYSEQDDDKVYSVSIDKEQGPKISATFDNLQDALEMFYKNIEKDD